MLDTSVSRVSTELLANLDNEIVCKKVELLFIINEAMDFLDPSLALLIRFFHFCHSAFWGQPHRKIVQRLGQLIVLNGFECHTLEIDSELNMILNTYITINSETNTSLELFDIISSFWFSEYNYPTAEANSKYIFCRNKDSTAFRKTHKNSLKIN
ncbi:hypothetical protein BpHYR1_045061 [Brachionus plicatilis]|uniref:Uncharacterized protein n=1 Tax=Brachionus plicatilis TaxID=10195 RepID=A0A3M7SL48_BRAPC|nr:hypothetical protein BpHYR1_045061 [Brachionus plicatilis]